MLAGYFQRPAEKGRGSVPNQRTRTFLYFSSLYRLQKSAGQTGALALPASGLPGGSESLGRRG